MRALCVARHRILSEHLCRFFDELGIDTVPCVGARDDRGRAVRDVDVIICDYDLLATMPTRWGDRRDRSRAAGHRRESHASSRTTCICSTSNGIAGFLYLPTLEPDDAQRVLAARAACARRHQSAGRSPVAGADAHRAATAADAGRRRRRRVPPRRRRCSTRCTPRVPTAYRGASSLRDAADREVEHRDVPRRATAACSSRSPRRPTTASRCAAWPGRWPAKPTPPRSSRFSATRAPNKRRGAAPACSRPCRTKAKSSPRSARLSHARGRRFSLRGSLAREVLRTRDVVVGRRTSAARRAR